MVFPGFRFLALLALARGSLVAVLAEVLAPGEPTTDDRERYNDQCDFKKTQLEETREDSK